MDLFLSSAVAIISIFVIMMSIMVINPSYTVADVGKFFISIMYIGVCTGAVTILRYFGVRFIVYLAGITVLTDIFALVFGMALGKHKMAPVLSPKKTIEGAIGGILGSVIVGGIIGYILYVNETHTPSTGWGLMIICFAGSIISQIGDLLASGIKRDHNIKDYGTLIPGHGGIMDRFDSVIFVIPCIYFLAAVILPVLG